MGGAARGRFWRYGRGAGERGEKTHTRARQQYGRGGGMSPPTASWAWPLETLAAGVGPSLKCMGGVVRLRLLPRGQDLRSL